MVLLRRVAFEASGAGVLADHRAGWVACGEALTRAPTKELGGLDSRELDDELVLIIRLGVGGAFELHRARVHRADPGDHLPQIVGRLDDSAEGGHRADHGLMLHAGVTRLLKGIRAERDQAEKSVVVALVNPGVVGQRRAHAATATAAMAAIAAEGQVFLMPLLGNGVDLAVIRIVQAGLRGGLDEVERRRGVASLAASTASGSASAPPAQPAPG